MSFFQRVVNHLLNEVLVNSLANSRTFQKFAVRSNAAMQEMAKKGGEHKETISSSGSEFFRVFKDELTKGFSAASKNDPIGPRR